MRCCYSMLADVRKKRLAAIVSTQGTCGSGNRRCELALVNAFRRESRRVFGVRVRGPARNLGIPVELGSIYNPQCSGCRLCKYRTLEQSEHILFDSGKQEHGSRRQHERGCWPGRTRHSSSRSRPYVPTYHTPSRQITMPTPKRNNLLTSHPPPNRSDPR